MASLGLTTDEIKGALGHYLGISRDATKWDADTVLDTNRFIRAGMRKFYAAHQWSFLEQAIKIVTTAPQTTGSIAVAAGTVTLTGSTWPTALVAEYLLAPESGGLYTFASRTSGTVAVLNDTSVTLTAGEEYTLYRINYPLPSYFAGWLDPVTRENDTIVREMATLPEWEVRAAGSTTHLREGTPEAFSVTQALADTDIAVPTYYLRVYPLPDNVYVLSSRVRVQPADVLDEAGTVIIMHPVFSECLQEAILSTAEMYANDQAGVHSLRWTELLTQSIEADRKLRGTRTLKPRDNAMRDPLYYLKVAPVEYDTL